jgi:hypothetical protein
VKYRTAGDVSTNSPGDWTRITANAALASATGRWTGPSNLKGGTSCVAQDAGGSNDPPTSAQDWAARLRDAAFADLVGTVTTHHATVKAELLWIATHANWNFDSQTRWCTGTDGLHDINPGFVLASWLTRLLFAYDYLGRAAFSAGELSTMDTWFWNAANYWRIDADNDMAGQFPNRMTDSDAGMASCQTESFCGGTAGAVTYTGGPAAQAPGTWNNNRRGSLWRFVGLVAIYLQSHDFTPATSRTDDGGATLTTLLTSAKVSVKELIRHTLHPDGSFYEFCRGEPGGIEDLGWHYTGSTLGQAITLADAFARTGDLALYTYNTAAGICSGGNSTAGTINDGGSRVGQNRDLLFAIQAYQKYPSDLYARYVGTSVPDNRLDGRDPRTPSWHSINDTSMAPANVYYKDAFVRQVLTRTHANSIAYPASPPTGSGQEPWQGENSIFPGVLFMFGQMDLETEIDPYTLTGAAPTCAITTDGGNGAGVDFSTAVATLTTFAGDGADSDGTVTSVAWTCATCSPTSDSATCSGCPGASITWNEPSLTLGTGANTLEVSVTDSDTNVCTDQITITYNPPTATHAPFRLVR